MRMTVKTKINDYLKRNKEALSTRSAKVGSYSFLLTVVVVCVLIAGNILAAALPSKWTQFDISAARLYSLTSDTKAVVTNLKKDVNIYWVTQAGKESEVIEKILDRYSDLSKHIQVEKKNPDVYPTFAKNYTEEEVQNNSIIVECGDKNRYIAYDTIYQTDYSNYYTTGSVSSSFDGEGAITSAINYVVSDELPKVYTLSGHGEAELTETFSTQIQRQNMETEDLSLLNVDEIPEDCDSILINAPTNDISEEERDMLVDYINDGGHVLVLSGPQQEEKLSHLKEVLEAYGVSAVDGVVVDTDRDHYAFTQPYVLMPEVADTDITAPLVEKSYHPILPVAQGFEIKDAPDGVTVTSLLNTSEDAISKKEGFDMSTFEKEEGDLDGPFSLAVSVEVAATDGKMVWIGCDTLLDETNNSYSAGANLNLVMNSLSWMIGEDSQTVAIRTKSLDYNYLTINESTAAMLKIIMIGIVPIGFLLYGLEEVLRRRKLS